ncbi:PGR5-like protein 1A, chloroplastic, partial [Tanacetum coccineum]
MIYVVRDQTVNNYSPETPSLELNERKEWRGRSTRTAALSSLVDSGDDDVQDEDGEEEMEINPKAKVSVKLVAEAGIGTVASGVAKGNAEIIQGMTVENMEHSYSSVKHCGSGPWELDTARKHQCYIGILFTQLMERFSVSVEHSDTWDMFYVRGGQKYKFFFLDDITGFEITYLLELPEPFSFIITWFAALPFILWISFTLTNVIVRLFVIEGRLPKL